MPPFPPPPPLKDVLEALQLCVLPAAGAAAVVMCVFLVLGRWATAIGSAVAVVAAFMCANFTLANIGSDSPSWENTSRLLLWKPGEEAPGYQWLPRAALVLVAVGLVSRWLGLLAAVRLPERQWWVANVLVWLPRAAALAVVSGWLVLGKAAEAPQWAHLRWELAAVMLLLWIVLDGLTRGGLSAEVSAYLGATLFTGAAVLLYTHNAKFMELAVVMGSAMFGIAAATSLVKSGAYPDPDSLADFNPNPSLFDARTTDTGPKICASGAIPAAVVFLVGLVIGTRPSHEENKVPVLCFWLVTLAPVVLAPFLIPRANRQHRWLMLAIRVVVVLAPLVAAVVLAGKHEKFPYELESQW